MSSQNGGGPFRPTCLIVDDEEAIRLHLQYLLKPVYNIYLAENGQRALDLLQSHPIDLVILDLKLPDLSGIEVLRRIRAGGSNVPVIILTGYGELEVLKHAANLAVSGYLDKPFEAEKLKEKIRDVLNAARPGWVSPAWSNGERPQDLFYQALNFMLTHYAKRLTEEGIANALNASPRRLKKIVRDRSGFTIKSYLIRIRINAAVSLIIGGSLPIKAIAFQVGYQSLALFYEHFERFTGSTPHEYRRQFHQCLLQQAGQIQ